MYYNNGKLKRITYFDDITEIEYNSSGGFSKLIFKKNSVSANKNKTEKQNAMIE